MSVVHQFRADATGRCSICRRPPFAHDEPGPPRARRLDPETSHAAAARVSPAVTNAILAAYLEVGDDGLTDDELCAMLPGRHPPTVKTARSRLSRAGMLADSGLRRLSDQGVEMVVWVVCYDRR